MYQELDLRTMLLGLGWDQELDLTTMLLGLGWDQELVSYK